MTFKDGNVVLGTAPLVNGQASLVNSVFAAGAQTLTASYSGDGSALAGSTSAGESLAGHQRRQQRASVASFAMPCYEAFPAAASARCTTSRPAGRHDAHAKSARPMAPAACRSDRTAANGSRHDHRHRRRLRRPQHRQRPDGLRHGLRPAGAAVVHQGQPDRRDQLSGRPTAAGSPRSPWTWNGSHAVAPGASILLVEANSNSDSDLYTAVNYARNARRGGGRVDELGRRRVFRRNERRQLFHHAQRPCRA